MIVWFLCAQVFASSSLEWTFETNDGGFSADNRLHWQWGLTGDGTWGWATRLHEPYLNDVTDSLQMPPLNLDGLSRPVLGLVHQYDIDASGNDAGWLETEIDGHWSPIDPVYGYPSPTGFSGFRTAAHTTWFDLSDLGLNPAIRFVFSSDEAVRRDGWVIDDVYIEDGDPIPPQFQWVSELENTMDVDGPYEVMASVVDDAAVDWVQIEWVDNQGSTGRDNLWPDEDGHFVGSIVGHNPGSTIDWRLEASDGLNLTHWPTDGTMRFSVYLPAPMGLFTEPEPSLGRLAETTVDLHWTPPETEHSIIGYVVARDGIDIAEPSSENCTVDLVDGPQQLTVRAVFDIDGAAFHGESSSAIGLDVSLPILETVEPNQAWPDDGVRVVLKGKNLYLHPETTRLDPGDGIAVESFEIMDAHTARALLNIDPMAQAGARQFVLTVGRMVVRSQSEFVVQSVGDRPVVLGAHPTSVRQGAQAKVFIDMSAPAQMTRPPPVVDLGEGIIVETVERRGSGLDVQLSVAHDAPLGAHPIEIDEGDRLVTGATLEVRDTPKVPERNCSNAPQRSAPWWAFSLASLAIAWRRRDSAK